MGVGSAFYKTYYLALGAVYIIVGSVPLGQMEALNTCKSRCPLAFPDREWKKWECALGPVKWDSLEGYRNAWVSFDNASCFVCESPSSTVLLEPCEPCEKYVEKVPSSKYSKSASCNDINTISQCSGATPPNFQPAVIANAGTRKAANTRDIPFTPEPDIGLRGQISPLTLGVAVIYVIQGVGCIIAGLGSGRFSGMYEDDWLKMSVTSKLVGCLVKFFPSINRALNFFQLFMLLFLGWAIFVFKTCDDAINEFSERKFFPFMQSWLIIALIVWLLCCVGGNITRRENLKDPAFINPLPDIKHRGVAGKIMAYTKFYCIKWCGECGGP
jgi:hypothetical protein|eukprot:g304.t1